jgi:3'-phosphoadenosine 5'-phosphosulfate sulfotransferase (PAPS reductase)/FAD synthetase
MINTNQDLVWLEPKSPKEIMDELIDDYKKDVFYCLLSGGQDSICTADYISKNYPENFGGCVFTNVGLGTQLTRKFVLEYARDIRGWEINMTWPKEKERFYNIVMKDGFAGAGNHRMWMGYLKYQTWYELMKRQLKKGQKACFISGVRKKESWARDKIKLYSKKPIDADGKLVFCKPFLYKNGLQLQEYFIKRGLKKSPAYNWFDKSGECWCGAHASPWELKMLEIYDPLTFETIQWLEKQIQIHGSKKAKKYYKWGMGPKTSDIKKQMVFDQFIVNEDYCGESCQVE